MSALPIVGTNTTAAWAEIAVLVVGAVLIPAVDFRLRHVPVLLSLTALWLLALVMLTIWRHS